MVVSSIKNYLILETDYEILSFTSPLKALDELSKTPVSLAISDFLMPEMDGIKFLKEVKKLYPKATLILLTGYADKENAIKAINELGIYKYIEKPWDNEDLKVTVDNAIERSDLVTALELKVEEVNEAHDQLEQYNLKLEKIVDERTQELSYTNAELKAIIESSADGILTLNSEFIVTSANNAVEKLTGLDKNNIIDQHINNLLGFSGSTNLLTRLNQGNSCLNTSCLIVNAEKNKSIPVEISIAPIEYDIKHDYVLVLRDVTAQKEMERLREDFIATLTHDLKTPLHASIQTLDYFLDGTLGGLSDKQSKLLDTMRSSNRDMLGLVNGLLEVYRIEAGKLNLVKDYFILHDIINLLLEEFGSLINRKNLTVSKELNNNPLNVFADKKEIKRVLANFLGNAINYTPADGKITVKTYVENSHIHLTVTDTGRGIPANDLNKLFQRFSQGTSKQRSTSTGLGLYLSKQIIEAHGGKVWVTSEENKGSSFGFSLPAIIEA